MMKKNTEEHDAKTEEEEGIETKKKYQQETKDLGGFRDKEVAEKSNLMALISTHNLITNDPQLTLRYLASQGQESTHFEDMFRLPRNDNIHAC